MKIKLVFVCAIYLFGSKLQAQVGIGTTNPDVSSILDISATDKGVLVPRVNLTDVTNTTIPITTPATGLLVWNTNAAVTGGNGVGFYFFNGTQWQSVIGIQKIDDLIDGKSDSDGTQDGSSVFLGLGSGFNDDSSDNQNVGVGSYSLYSNTTGYQNVAIGRGTLINNTTGFLNTAVGYASMNFQPINGRHNTALGALTLNLLVNAQYNTAIGYRALYSNNGGNNTAVGNESMLSTTTGGFNTAIGNRSLYSNTSGVRNTAIGSRSLYSNSVGSDNVAIGNNAGYFETGSNKLYIENSNSTTPLIYGEFDTNLLRVNGTLDINNEYQFPITDGTVNQIMQTDGAGNISWVDATSVGIADHDFYEEGTTTAPDDISDDQFTMGNLAIGKNTADYPLDIENTNGGRGISILMNGSTNTIHYGSYSELNGSGSGIHYGAYNTLTGSGTGRQYGVYNEINNSGNANHFGSYSALTGSGSGSHYGNWVRLEGAGTGNQIGAYNFINNSGDGDHYGSYNVLSGTGSGPHYGNWARLFGAGTGQQYGNYTLISNSGNATHYGDFIRLDGSGSGTHYGNWIRLHGTGTGFQVGNNINIDNSGNNNHWGEFIVLSGSGSGVHYGSEVILSGSGIGDQIGYRAATSNSGNGDHIALDNNFSGTGNGPQYGVKNYFSNNGASNPQYGLFNEIYSQGDGLHYGLYSTISNSGNGNKYGVFSQINGSGSGAKYGTYNTISSSSGGTHYGIYSNVLKAGSYAGYFLGNVSIGTTVGNNYILPPSRGTNGQIMQTDGTGNLSWVDDPSPSYWSRTGAVLNLANAGDDITFSNDQTSITFPASNGTPAPMLYMFSGGTTNADKMVLAHSVTYSNYGLLYNDADDSFRFLANGVNVVEIDLTGSPVLSVVGNVNVNGDIITDTTTYPDYVFESYYNGKSNLNKEYSFKTLAEVEAFIKKNGHLPNVKSYHEVKDNGMTIDVGEMTITNLEKIEEAYVYIIELKKENEALKNKLASQEKEINRIKEVLKM